MSKESVAEAKKRADALAKKKKAAEVPRPRPYITARGCSSVAERPLCMRKAQGSNPCSSSLTYAVGTGFPELTRFPLRRKRRTRPRARARSSAEPAEMHDKLPTGFHGLVSLSNIGELTTYEELPRSPCCFAAIVGCRHGDGVLTRYTSHSRRRDGVMVDATRLRELMHTVSTRRTGE